jgi:Flp pilus assembly pilin Flp
MNSFLGAAMARAKTTVGRVRRDRRGQDLVEYSLAVAFVAVAASAFFPPSIAPAISSIWNRIVQILGQTGAGS